MQIIRKNISELIPAQYNPRKDLQPGDSEYDHLKRSIKEFGCVEPIIFNECTGRVAGVSLERDNNNLSSVLFGIWEDTGGGKVTGDLSELEGYTGDYLNLIGMPLVTGNLSSIANMRAGIT